MAGMTNKSVPSSPKNGMSIEAKIKMGVESYTGKKVLGVKFVEDPIIAGTYAIRAQMTPKKHLDFLLVTAQSVYDSSNIHAMTPLEIGLSLEDVTFSSFPPKSF